KERARAAVAGWLSAEHPVYVRVNVAGSRWFEEDLEIAALPGVRGIVVPQVAEAGELAPVAARLTGEADIIAMVETALGVWNVRAIASAPRVRRVAFGALDLQADTGISGDGKELDYARTRLVLASRVAGIEAPIDGVTTAIEDEARLR